MKPQVVSFRCTLRGSLGQLISTTFSQDVLTAPVGAAPPVAQPAPAPSGSPDSLPGLARRMKNLRKGERRRIFLAAPEAYGLYDPELVIETSRREFSSVPGLSLGDQVYAEGGDGTLRPYRVTSLGPTSVTLDANHPLAGQDLTFDIEVTDARYATKEELRDSDERPAPGRWVH